MVYDAIIIGGGAAGLMCAFTAAKLGRSVVLLEHQPRLGNKILISGGGRCNFTNLGATAQNYVTQGSPHFCKSALARYTPADFLNLVQRYGIAWHEKKLGQLFCDLSSRDIVNVLQSECDSAGVEIRLGCQVRTVRKVDRFQVETSRGEIVGRTLVIATGGLSFPKLGATPFGYQIAEQFGVKLVPPRPGLVPLVFKAEDSAAFGGLSGVSVEVSARGGLGKGPAFRENLLFTHRGLSGPAILQVSSHLTPGEPVILDLLPGRDVLGLLEQERRSTRELRNLLAQWLPQRVAEVWCQRWAPSRPISQMSKREMQELAGRIQAWELHPGGDEGYPKAEVTVGGVDTAELSSKTMESRQVPGLFFIGEVVDITGWLGGYNFQWAWASGHAAGQAIAQG